MGKFNGWTRSSNASCCVKFIHRGSWKIWLLVGKTSRLAGVKSNDFCDLREFCFYLQQIQTFIRNFATYPRKLHKYIYVSLYNYQYSGNFSSIFSHLHRFVLALRCFFCQVHLIQECWQYFERLQWTEISTENAVAFNLSVTSLLGNEWKHYL